MNITEFSALSMLEGDANQQGLVPRGTTVKRLKRLLYDEGYGEIESPELTQALLAMRRRRLVISAPSRDAALWLPTIYGRNVVTA